MRVMTQALRHRGPDAAGVHCRGPATLGHRRLSIIDLGPSGVQPMRHGPWTLVFNGEIYNHLELRPELEAAGWSFRSRCDTEALLAAWATWGPDCLDRLVGMFAFALWNENTRQLDLVRDRFGVKPLYWTKPPGARDDTVVFASEIRALHAVGLGREPEFRRWAEFLGDGASESRRGTFWRDVERLGPGEHRRFDSQGASKQRRWYDLAARTEQADERPEPVVREEVGRLLAESVALRYRADVPLGINLSGGLDSSLLLALSSLCSDRPLDQVHAFTFATDDPDYDETPWVEALLAERPHPLHVVTLTPSDVPALAETVAAAQSEPAGGLPTLAYAKLMTSAADLGFKVLLDGQGLDEAWAGYDYYRRAVAPADLTGVVQGSSEPATRPSALSAEARALLTDDEPIGGAGGAAEGLRRLQLADFAERKLPRALRYNDRISMLASVELREPFLDHRLVELGVRQPAEHKIDDDSGKVMLRRIAAELLPETVRLAPKRPLQTPQREWLRGPLRDWAESHIDDAVATGWLERSAVEHEWSRFLTGEVDNSFFVWQWIDLAMTSRPAAVEIGVEAPAS